MMYVFLTYIYNSTLYFYLLNNFFFPEKELEHHHDYKKPKRTAYGLGRENSLPKGP